ncbi:MAG: phenylalanine--tRNA ligase subunit beta [Paludibacteraceae bacterium]|nr:phenylalanine--tRNA ligase subunit beta [Paludibacteraceae bacterium]MBP6284719.1 phenylalanine--tRNA ligase subunit beta [Paludibacteraceae bacterium]
MNISYNWLKQYVNINLPAEKVSQLLTSLGLEVGSVEEVETIKGSLKGLVVGEVLECAKHPDADRLQVTKVRIDPATEPIQIVCGAPNCRTGIKVVVATVGTTLYSGDDSFAIKRSKIRGVESNGMLCGEDEIGVGTSHDGIIEINQGVEVGTLVKDLYSIENDTVLEVDITPNRVDATSHIGVARDLVAALRLKDKTIFLTKPSVEAFAVDNTNYTVKVDVPDSTLCPRYCGVTISNIKVSESPDWLKNRLIMIGMRPINNVVDITNFVLHETGQPLHAFDGDRITGNKIRVTTLDKNTPFVTLDEVERKLSSEDLMICNANEGMCIAGIFGGLHSGVTETTTKLFLESAYFNPINIRKTARFHGLNTDSSFRFERGVDPNNIVYALKRAALLIKEIAGGEISSEIVDIYPTPIANFDVTVTYTKINALIGKIIEKETIKTILTGLEIDIINEDNDTLQLSVPAYRVDVQRDVDVIEEILRVYGYNNILPTDELKSSITYAVKPDTHKLQNTIAEQLTGAGFNEILNNSLTKIAYYKDLQSYPESEAVKMLNPLSADLSVMRQTLLFGGLESTSYNRNRKNSNLKLYEFGNCYHYHAEKKNTENPLKAYSEELHLSLWISGNKAKQSWTDSERKVNFYDLKGYAETILIRLGLKNSAITTSDYSSDILSNGLMLTSKTNLPIATLGIVSSKVLKQFDIDTEVFFADFYWENLLKIVGNQTVRYHEIPKFQAVKRDLALVLDKDIRFQDIEELALATEKNLLKKVQLFDVYEGKNIDQDKKSYAVSFILQHEQKTLEDKQIDGIMQKLLAAFETQLGAKLRQ